MSDSVDSGWGAKRMKLCWGGGEATKKSWKGREITNCAGKGSGDEKQVEIEPMMREWKGSSLSWTVREML